jgi:hypothetical protein
LLHDDIIDGNQVRRGRDSARRKFGVAETLVTGDFLFSRAFQICGRFDERLIHWAAEACIALTEGEIMQGRFSHNAAVTYADYLEIISRKTASLFEVGARTAAYLAGADDSAVEAMARCGRHVGLTFQMVDDLLDVTGSEATLGKPIGVDVREGNPALPVARPRRDDDPTLFGFTPARWRHRAQPPAPPGDHRTRPSGTRARRIASERALPESPYRQYSDAHRPAGRTSGVASGGTVTGALRSGVSSAAPAHRRQQGGHAGHTAAATTTSSQSTVYGSRTVRGVAAWKPRASSVIAIWSARRRAPMNTGTITGT